MKKLMSNILSCLLLFPVLELKAQQTVIYSNNFSGGSAGWSLGQAGNFDTWAINSTYSCSDPTPDQGGGNYLHVTDDLNGEYCAAAVFFGLGSSGQSYATMTTGISTIGFPEVWIQFDWLCKGQTGAILASFGTVEYSTDGGTSWTIISNPISQYNGQDTWTNTIISSLAVPALLNQSDLRLRFGFTNSGYGLNPAFAIDNIVIADNIPTALQIKQKQIPLRFLYDADANGLTITADEQNDFKIGFPVLVDLSGKVIQANCKLVTSNSIHMSFDGIANGLYVLQYLNADNAYSSKIRVLK